MRDPVIIEDQSITTSGKQTLVIDKKDIEYMDCLLYTSRCV